ncbi:Derlin-2 [Porphyridium purpureum]|uniref:Derlin n=1 Tax=Porphyridium purpureum TaxID=35688 RepID=A0A5J4Z6C4_PORPP|nr:Derlin-2 [Porphyridium purpureum]|eukprot:POR0436..scf295_1
MVRGEDRNRFWKRFTAFSIKNGNREERRAERDGTENARVRVFVCGSEVHGHWLGIEESRDMALVMEFFNSVPPITRTYVGLSVLTTVACALDLVSPLKLYLNWSAVFRRMQVWRVFTNFFFFGSFGLDFVFHMYFLYRYSKLLEFNSFRGRTADFLYMLMFGSIMLLLFSPITPSIVFLGPSLSFMMVYVWGRRNELEHLSFLGLFRFRAPYLPWVLLVFSIVLGSSPVIDLLGIFAGHIYFYLVDVYPQISGVHLLKTPRILCQLVGFNEAAAAYAVANAAGQQQRRNADGANFGWGQGRNL